VQHAESADEKFGLWQRYKWPILGLGALLVGLILGWVFIAILDATYTYHGTVIQSPDPAKNFVLTGPDGQTVNLEDFRGKAVMIYFGYTFCPDVCPATLVELAKANQLLGEDAEGLQVIMVTVDPQRDTPEKLETYVTHFDPGFLGLTGTADEIAAAATPFGIYYEKREGSEATGYLMDHTASVIVLDPEGHLRLIYPFGTSGEDIAEDIRHLVR
jgi:protein SCO1/2